LRAFLVRTGLAALGVLYVVMGIVSARVALLGAKDRGQGVPGALAFLLERPLGPWILGAVVAGLAGIALAHAAGAVRGRERGVARVLLAVNAIGYAALVWTAARLLLHLRRGGGLEEAGASWLFAKTWGPAVVKVVAVLVAAGGAWELWQGIRGKLTFRRDLLPRGLVKGLSAIARFGLLSRGLVVVAVGYFLFRAAAELDAQRVPTIGGALRAFSHTALGPVFVGVVALGLSAYGVYLWTLMLLKRRV
jgi:hypothetical protein